MKELKEVKKELGLTNKKIAGLFGITPGAYANSSAKKRYEKALVNIYKLVKKKSNGKSNKV